MRDNDRQADARPGLPAAARANAGFAAMRRQPHRFGDVARRRAVHSDAAPRQSRRSCDGWTTSAMYRLLTVGSYVLTLGVRSPLPLGGEERVRWVLRVCLVARSGEIPPFAWFLRTQTGRDLTMADPTSGKRAKDSDIEMGAVGTAGAVASALTALDGFLKAQPQGQGAKQLFRNVRAASPLPNQILYRVARPACRHRFWQQCLFRRAFKNNGDGPCIRCSRMATPSAPSCRPRKHVPFDMSGK
jgi:hypothetical protein